MNIIQILKYIFILLWTVFWSSVSMIVPIVDWRGKIHSLGIRLWAKGALWVSGVKLNVSGIEYLKAAEPAVFVLNHESAIDIPVSIAALPTSHRFMAKRELFKIPVFGWGLKLGGHISIDRSNPKRAIRSINYGAAKVIAKKQNITVSPEGTRSSDGRLQRFKKGAFIVARDFDIPIIPVTMMGNRYCVANKSLKILSGKIEVNIHHPRKVSDFEKLEDCIDDIHAEMAKIKDQYEDKRQANLAEL